MKCPSWARLGALPFVLACSQKDPPAVSAGHFPLQDGARWSYLHSNGAWTETVTMEARGERFVVASSADPMGISSESTLERIDGEVLRVSEDTLIDDVLEQTVTYDPGFLRFADAWKDAEPGRAERRTYLRTETKAGMAPKPPVERAHVFTVEALSESVTVPAGTFRDCVRVRRSRDLGAVEPDAGATAAQSEQEKLYWFCPGVGKAREENALTGSTEVLVEYDLPES